MDMKLESGYKSSGSQGSRGSHGSKGDRKWYGKTPMRSVQNTQNHCFFCKKPGHWMNQCPVRADYNRRSGQCMRCGRSGHWAKDCPKRHERKSSLSSNGSRNSSPNYKGSFQGTSKNRCQQKTIGL